MTVTNLMEDLGLTEEEILELAEDNEFAEDLENALRLDIQTIVRICN